MNEFENRHFTEVDSTNVEAVREITNGNVFNPTVFWADTQTAGKGTRGRSWQSQVGNVHATYVFPLSIAIKDAPLLVYSIALAVHDTLAEFIQNAPIQIKWPNDILVAEEKISGSLHEIAYFERKPFFVAGIGINNEWKPDSDVLYPASCIADFSKNTPKVADLVQKLGENIRLRIIEFEKIGFQGQKAEFLESSFRYGEELQIRLRGDRQDEHNGVFEGIDTDGALVLRTSTGIERFVAGDIFPLL